MSEQLLSAATGSCALSLGEETLRPVLKPWAHRHERQEIRLECCLPNMWPVFSASNIQDIREAKWKSPIKLGAKRSLQKAKGTRKNKRFNFPMRYRLIQAIHCPNRSAYFAGCPKTLEQVVKPDTTEHRHLEACPHCAARLDRVQCCWRGEAPGF